MSKTEQPAYTVVTTDGPIEVRDYPPLIVAEVEVAGERGEAISAGFRLLAGYIFGNNLSAGKIAMTAPVTQQPSEKIAMTAPVLQQGAGSTWQVRFVMPSRYTMDTLPRPRNPEVHLREIPARRFAVIRFSGLATEASLARHTGTLQAWLLAQRHKARAAPTYAFYNPPWTLPFLRRNEVMIEIAR